MIDYRKPSKAKANEEFLRQQGLQKEVNPYTEESINQKKLFLIICEGKNTEPIYFESFPVPTKTVLVEGGCGSKTALVDYALKISKLEKYENREVWCVFDFDIKPDESATQPEDFNNSIQKAEQNGMNVAWSNDAFELWFILHYQTLETSLTRTELYPILKKQWNLESFSSIAKSKEFCKEHYKRLGGSQSESQKLAIMRAEKLHTQYKNRKDYSEHCPCTTVYLLVKELNKNIKP